MTRRSPAPSDRLFAICIFLWTLPLSIAVFAALISAATTPEFWVAFAVGSLIAGVR